MLVCVLIAIWISVKSLGRVACHGESEKWVIDMLFFAFLLALVSISMFPYLTCTLQATSGSGEFWC